MEVDPNQLRARDGIRCSSLPLERVHNLVGATALGRGPLRLAATRRNKQGRSGGVWLVCALIAAHRLAVNVCTRLFHRGALAASRPSLEPDGCAAACWRRYRGPLSSCSRPMRTSPGCSAPIDPPGTRHRVRPVRPRDGPFRTGLHAPVGTGGPARHAGAAHRAGSEFPRRAAMERLCEAGPHGRAHQARRCQMQTGHGACAAWWEASVAVPTGWRPAALPTA